MLVSKNLAMSLHAPTSDYDVTFYETAVGQIRWVLREARGMRWRLQCGVGHADRGGVRGPFCWGIRKAHVTSHGKMYVVEQYGRIRMLCDVHAADL